LRLCVYHRHGSTASPQAQHNQFVLTLCSNASHIRRPLVRLQPLPEHALYRTAVLRQTCKDGAHRAATALHVGVPRTTSSSKRDECGTAMRGPDAQVITGEEVNRRASDSTAGGATAGVTTADDTNTTAGASPSSAGDNNSNSHNGAEMDINEDTPMEPQGTLSFIDAKFAVFASDSCVFRLYGSATGCLHVV
jgi:hypothetical protein